eukprot:9464782-Pyramimonas_sp.AAC.1
MTTVTRQAAATAAGTIPRLLHERYYLPAKDMTCTVHQTGKRTGPRATTAMRTVPRTACTTQYTTGRSITPIHTASPTTTNHCVVGTCTSTSTIGNTSSVTPT